MTPDAETRYLVPPRYLTMTASKLGLFFFNLTTTLSPSLKGIDFNGTLLEGFRIDNFVLG